MGLSDAPRLNEPVTITFPDLLGPAGVSRDGGVTTLGILVDGEWRGSSDGDTFDVPSPIDGGVIARAQRASKDDVNAAIVAARAARATWRQVPAAERLEICE